MMSEELDDVLENINLMIEDMENSIDGINTDKVRKETLTFVNLSLGGLTCSVLVLRFLMPL